MRRVAILMMLLAFGAGCRKKSAPQYYEYESRYSILVAREGDDAYGEPEMDQLEAGLAQIPADAVEGPKASELAAKIKAERERVAREEKEREAALAAASDTSAVMPSAPSLFPKETPPGEAGKTGAAATDAGRPERPWGGMKLAELQQYFGDCFVPGPAKTLPGQPEGASMQVKDEPGCRQRFGSAAPGSQSFYVFVKDTLVGQVTESQKAGPPQPVAPPPPPPAPQASEDGGIVHMIIPGAPAPAGYTGIPGAPQGAPAAGPAPE